MSLLSKVVEAINKAMDTEADQILRELRDACPKDTGKTAKSFRIMSVDSSYTVGTTGQGVKKRVLIASDKLTAYWADHGNYDSGWVIYPTHQGKLTKNGKRKPPMLGKYPKGIPGYGWRAHVNAYEGTHFVREVADRHR